MAQVPALLGPIAQAFAAAGTPAYLVGGAVRDLLTGEPIHDYDLASAADPDTAAALLRPFGVVYPLGARYGTVAVVLAVDGRRETIEVTTFRTETYPDAASRRPEVTFTDRLVDDLARRDFTVNAMAADLTDGTIIDPFDGAGDLARRVLRTPGDPDVAFGEDPLRIVRAARFAAVRGFWMTPEVIDAAGRLADRLETVATERTIAELEKVLRLPGAVAPFLDACDTLGVTSRVFGPFASSDPALRAVLAQTENRVQALAALSVFSNTAPVRLLEELRMDRATVRAVTATVAALEVMRSAPSIAELRYVYRQVGAGAFVDAAAVATADDPSNRVLFDTVVAEDPSGPLPVTGADLVAAGFSGSAVGDALRKITQAFCEDPNIDAAGCWQALNS